MIIPIFTHKKKEIDISDMDDKTALILIILSVAWCVPFFFGGVYVLILMALGKW